MLETTKVKLVQSYENATKYVQYLIKEKTSLANLANNEIELNKIDNKQEIFQRLNELELISDIYSRIEKCKSDLKDSNEMFIETKDDEMKEMFEKDIEKLNEKIVQLKIDMIQTLVKEENEDKENAYVEISAGVGGLESRIFCSELFEMYRLYSDFKNWSFSPIKVYTDITELGEMMRQARIEISGQNVFKYLKFESGVHRVQRVPKTESSGRIHTSTCGVVVTPKPEKVNIEINPKDLKIETKTSGGPGGQHANKTKSAVRLTHLPTGIVIYCDEERHMMQNRSRAFENLEEKLYQRAYEEELNKRQRNRKMQIGSSGRSERIRTYNFIQDRITDHRLDENFQGISRFLSGSNLLDSMIENLHYEHQFDLLNEILESFHHNKK